MVGNYDLVHLHNPIPALEMKRIAQACVTKKVPYVLTTHGFVEIYDMKTAYRLGAMEAIAGRLFVTRAVDYVVKHAARVCCLAPQDKAMLAARASPTTDWK